MCSARHRPSALVTHPHVDTVGLPHDVEEAVQPRRGRVQRSIDAHYSLLGQHQLLHFGLEVAEARAAAVDVRRQMAPLQCVGAAGDGY